MTVTEEQEVPNTKSLNQFKDGAPEKNIDSEKQTEKKTKRSFGFGSKSSEDTGKKSSSKININRIFGRVQKNKNKTPVEELSAASCEPPKVLEVPEFIPVSEDDKLIEQYWLTPPYASTAIYKDRLNKYHYKIIEPQITEKEFLILEETFEYLRSTLIYDSVKKRDEMQLSHDTMKSAIKKFDKEITDERTEILIYYLFRNFMGYGKLDPLMNDEMIEDISCSGSDIPIFIYHRRYGGVQTNCIFAKEELNKFVLKLSQKADKQLSLTTPLVDAALPNGSRAQITYSDIVSSKGSSFTIRKFKSDPMNPAELVKSNTFSAELMAYIWLAVENGKSMIVSGGTASGKTSTMNAVSFFIPSVAKIVSIEDTCEIQLPHENWLSMKTRESGAVQSQSSITMFSLLKAALRQRPEYIIVGEVRGAEAQTLFQAMNTGHTTYSTLHAGNVSEAVNRLTHDPINVPDVMFGALDLLLVQSLLYTKGVGFRRCTSLNEISVDKETGTIKWTPIFEWNHKTDTFDKVCEKSEIFESIAYQNGWTDEEMQKRIDDRINLLTELSKREHVTTKEMEDEIISLGLEEQKYV